jgi:hypothetical protein
MKDQKLQMQMEEHKEASQVNFINQMFIHNLAKTINITVLLILQLQYYYQLYSIFETLIKRIMF